MVAKHTAIMLTDHLVDSCKDVFKSDEAVYLQMHRTKCSANIQHVYKDLADFALSFLVLPHFNAEVERVFSEMNTVKSKGIKCICKC